MQHRVGEMLRQQRKAKKLSLRDVSNQLDLDVAIISKLERGERAFNKKLIIAFSTLYQLDVKQLLAIFYADKLLKDIDDDEIVLDAIRLAEESVQYRTNKKESNAKLFSQIKRFFDVDKRVKRAWVFGSVSRGEATNDSDIDIMIEFNTRKKYSMFDLIDIAHTLEKKIKRKVDLSEKGALYDFAKRDAEKDLIQIYGKA